MENYYIGIKVPTIEEHKNLGNWNASFEYSSEVLDFLLQVAHDEGESQATRFVRELTGIGICNNKKFGFTLPPYNTKRKLYERYCYYNGWKTRQTPRGNYTRVAEYKLRKNDDELEDMALWPTGSVVLPVCTFSTFRTLWKRFFPLLKIRTPSEDICLQCHIFKNQYKYASHKRKAYLY